MQSVSSRIWTRVAVSISYDDNDYTTGIVFNRCDIADEIWGMVFSFQRHAIQYEECSILFKSHAGWKLYKNTIWCFEKILEAAPLKNSNCTATCLPSHIQVRRAKHPAHCCRSNNEFISDVFLWTPTRGHISAGPPAKDLNIPAQDEHRM